MGRKICTRCNMEPNTEGFYNKDTECKFFNSKRSLKCYYDKKEKLSNQTKYNEKKTKKTDGYTINKEILRSYVELENKLKALEEKVKISDSENN